MWRKWLTRRTRGKVFSWSSYAELLQRHALSLPRIVQPWAVK